MRQPGRSSGWIEIIEASYRVELDEGDWLRNVLAAAGTKLDHGLGAWAMSYDLEGTHGVRTRTITSHHLPGGEASLGAILEAQAKIPPSAIAQTFQTTTCGTASQLLGKSFQQQTSIDKHKDTGLADSLGINVRDPTATGCVFVGLLPSVGAITAAEEARWKKVTAHVAAGFRIQRARRASGRAGSTEGAEAILTTAGRMEHAEEPDKTKAARAQLREAVRGMEQARTARVRASADDGMNRWRGLVAARWTLLDHLEVDGRRYVLARHNAPIDEGLMSLTQRETQVLGYAALGHTNKLIAYDLGIADSTVRVLLSRAATKLGTSTRGETVRAFTAMTRARPEPG